jgi:hypothetical protein
VAKVQVGVLESEARQGSCRNDRSGAGAGTGAESTSDEDRKHGLAATPARSEGEEVRCGAVRCGAVGVGAEKRSRARHFYFVAVPNYGPRRLARRSCIVNPGGSEFSSPS